MPQPDRRSRAAQTAMSPLGVMNGSALSELPPRDATALVRTVHERLKAAITFGELAPGTRLNQVQVAQQLGVSRMPVRAAVSDLQAEGLLEPLPNGGVRVRELTSADIQAVYEVRIALETEAARHVATSEAATGLDEVDDVLREHGELGGSSDPVALLELDRRFHMAILDATGNPGFRRAIGPIWPTVERAMVGLLVSIPEMFESAWMEHHKIAEALRSGDPERAQHQVRAHLESAAERLARTMPDAAR